MQSCSLAAEKMSTPSASVLHVAAQLLHGASGSPVVLHQPEALVFWWHLRIDVDPMDTRDPKQSALRARLDRVVETSQGNLWYEVHQDCIIVYCRSAKARVAALCQVTRSSAGRDMLDAKDAAEDSIEYADDDVLDVCPDGEDEIEEVQGNDANLPHYKIHMWFGPASCREPAAALPLLEAEILLDELLKSESGLFAIRPCSSFHSKRVTAD